MTQNRTEPFDIIGRRAMISLGSLSADKACPYSCRFCYVPHGFPLYDSASGMQTADWLLRKKRLFDIIYISGDTDSFAPPRTERALNLLADLAQNFDKDIMITTRADLPLGAVEEISMAGRVLRGKGRTLYSCISITSPDDNKAIEPPPIPSAAARLENLAAMKACGGMKTVLAMRPFLPVYSAEDYEKLVCSARNCADYVLGGTWHYNKEMWRGITGREAPAGIEPKPLAFCDGLSMMDYAPEDIEKQVSDYCAKLGLPFFMNSADLVRFDRQKGFF